MRRRVPLTMLAVMPAIAAALGVTTAAQTPAAPTQEQKDRFAQVHALMAIPLHGDDVIDQEELAAFLVKQVPRETILAESIVTPEWAREQAINLFNQANTIKTDGGIDARELNDLEAASLKLLPNLRTATDEEKRKAATIAFKALLPKGPATPSKPVPFADRLGKFLQIRQSFLDDKLVEKPATISFSTLDVSDETLEKDAERMQWSIAAAAVFKPNVLVLSTDRWEVYPVLAYEAAVSSGLKTDVNAITHRGGFAGSWLNDTASFAHAFTATVDYGTDHRYAADVWGGTIQYSPSWGAAAIGRFTDVAGPVRFTWRPYIGFTFGDVVNKGERTGLDDKVDFSDFYAKVGSKLLFSTHAALINDVTFFHQFRGAKNPHGLFESAFNIYITPEDSKTPVSLQLSGAVGRKSPLFKKQQSAKVALALKF
jgi:hypothetical protein